MKKTLSNINKRYIVIFVVLLFLVAILSIFFYISNIGGINNIFGNQSFSSSSQAVQGISDNSTNQISLNVTNGSDSKDYKIGVNLGSNLFDILTSYEAKDPTFSFGYQTSSIGVYLTTVNGRLADTSKNEFWNIKLNGKDSQVGVKDLIPTKGDSIQLILTTF